MESKLKYVISKEGIIKFLVLLFGCTTFALIADSNSYSYPSAKTWAFAAYIISWSISLLFYFFHATGLARQMNCGGSCTYDGFDFLWSWLSTIHILGASIAFSIYVTGSSGSAYYAKQASAAAIGFMTFALYAVESFVLRSYAPANAGYIATWRGWLKTAILVGGAASFSLLVDSGYSWCRTSCEIGLTYALSAYCIAWGISVFVFLGRMFLPASKSSAKPFTVFQFVWSVISCLLFLSASSCFAAYMKCSNFDYNYCRERLAGVVVGFVTAILYIVDAVVHRPQR
uniref:Myeloid-associated differentiation marker-like protein 2 n=1 Tax=Ciona intestinalis TaxID=7719 RepID=F6ZJ69_CIOIN|nr:myeloid-associated differentiation marker-like protein 2 isoform X1 [Ciona intestinalis]|eukprot:XP_009858308.1 myeloid-associated differentiation marker-like protein 2 isoform X1 [Ciona intestinalis]